VKGLQWRVPLAGSSFCYPKSTRTDKSIASTHQILTPNVAQFHFSALQGPPSWTSICSFVGKLNCAPPKSTFSFCIKSSPLLVSMPLSDTFSPNDDQPHHLVSYSWIMEAVPGLQCTFLCSSTSAQSAITTDCLTVTELLPLSLACAPTASSVFSRVLQLAHLSSHCF
jgi:hypothetical protein